jgi:hydroxypyruvate isomerase
MLMPRFDANLTTLFTEAPFMDRFALAAEAGFSEVEFQYPYEYKPPELKRALAKNGLRQVLFNLPPGDRKKGDHGIASSPERIEEFRSGVPRAIEYALELGVPRMNCLAGRRAPGYDDNQHRSVLSDNVKYAAEALGRHGLQLMIEQLNHFDVPGFFLNKAWQVMDIIEAVGMPNVFMQFDVYHCQREEGEIANNLRKYISKIGHIQIADNPGRHEPGTGEINYPFVLREIDALGYEGYVGLEYIPATDTISSLGWMTRYRCGMDE